MKILVTGSAGFIGMHVAMRLLADGHTVVGLDNLNDYYDVQLKQARLKRLSEFPGFRFIQRDIGDASGMASLFSSQGFGRVVHLAAQAGVRYSLKNPQAYVSSNVSGFLNILEGCRHHAIDHLVYASSSSVYGNHERMPCSEHDAATHPVSLYAATKRANELMAHSYSHLFGFPTTGLRFFTVYGPWGRPDMAYYQFTKSILEGRAIQLFNHGQMRRDFTYIDDIVEGVVCVLDRPATAAAQFDRSSPDPALSDIPWRIFNIGNRQPVSLERLVATLENCLGRQAVKEFLPMQPGDVVETYADVSELEQWVGYAPDTVFEEGMERFVSWYRSYHP
jgi:UDP-glucuronate 4-epimerase